MSSLMVPRLVLESPTWLLSPILRPAFAGTLVEAGFLQP